MPSISVEVEVDYSDFDVDELAKVLIRKTGWEAALNKAVEKCKDKNSASVTGDNGDNDDEIKDLIQSFRRGGNITPIIAQIAYNRYGLVV